MEGIAAVGTIDALISLASLSLKIAKFTKDYIEEVREAPASITKFLREVQDLCTVLHTIEERVKDRLTADSLLLTLEAGAAEAALKRVFEKLRSSLEGHRLLKAAKWPFSGKRETEELITFVHRYLDLFRTALAADISENVSFLVNRSKSTLNQDILNWLCPWDPNPSSRLSSFLARRKGKNAGCWLLNSDSYKDWKTTAGDVLWLYGGGGVGKTILASIVIEELLVHASTEPQVGVIYLYFDYTSPDTQQTANSSFSSLVRQCIVMQHKIPDALERYFKETQDSLTGNKGPSESELYKLLVEACNEFQQIYIVLDALDELRGSETATDRRQPFLQQIRKLQADTTCDINLLVTSRPDFYDIQQFFSGSRHLEIVASASDIEEYVRGELSATTGLLGDMVAQDDDLKLKIPADLAAKSRGMFLVAVLHFELLKGTTSREEVEEVLNAHSMHGSLSTIYDQTLARINNQNYYQARLGTAVLKWVYNTGGSLTIAALQHALALDPALVESSPEELNPRVLRPEKAITMFCAGLVMIEPVTNLVRFKHYTIQQYFQGHPKAFQDDSFQIAKTALRYLQLGILGDHNPYDFFRAPDYGTARYDHLAGRVIEEKSFQYPLLDFVYRSYRNILVIRLEAQETQDGILKAIFATPASLDVCGRCTEEVQTALRSSLATLLSAQVPFSHADILLFLNRGVTPSAQAIDLSEWGPRSMAVAINDECVSAVKALLSFGLPVDKGLVELAAKKWHENDNLTMYLMRVDYEHILDDINEIENAVVAAWMHQNPGKRGPVRKRGCESGKGVTCECSSPVVWDE